MDEQQKTSVTAKTIQAPENTVKTEEKPIKPRGWLGGVFIGAAAVIGASGYLTPALLGAKPSGGTSEKPAFLQRPVV